MLFQPRRLKAKALGLEPVPCSVLPRVPWGEQLDGRAAEAQPSADPWRSCGQTQSPWHEIQAGQQADSIPRMAEDPVQSRSSSIVLLLLEEYRALNLLCQFYLYHVTLNYPVNFTGKNSLPQVTVVKGTSEEIRYL